MRHHVVIRTLVVWIGLVIPAMAYAHPGGRDAEGCHICRSKCERYDVTPDVRHCHGVKRAEEVKPAEKVPAKPKFSNSGMRGLPSGWIVKSAARSPSATTPSGIRARPRAHRRFGWIPMCPRSASRETAKATKQDRPYPNTTGVIWYRRIIWISRSWPSSSPIS